MMIQRPFKAIMSMVHLHVHTRAVKIFQQRQDVSGTMGHLVSGGKAGGTVLPMMEQFADLPR